MTMQNQLALLVNELSATLAGGVIDHLRECIEAGELKLAVEEMCAYIGEAGYKVSLIQFQTIQTVANELAVEPKWWRVLSQE